MKIFDGFKYADKNPLRKKSYIDILNDYNLLEITIIKGEVITKTQDY